MTDLHISAATSRSTLERRAGLLLVLIVAAGALARFWNLGWDQGAYTFHPDEWALNEVVRRLGPDLNPHFFFYGAMPIYLYRITAEALGWLTGADWLDHVRLPLIGRFYSASAETAMLPLMFVVGRRLFSTGAGLLAALFAAGAPLLIQAAHFGTVDSLLTLSGVILLWVSLRLAREPRPVWYALAGAALGAALATKLTSTTFVMMPALAHFAAARTGESPRAPRGVGPLFLMAGLGVVVCLLLSPYYALDAPGLWAAIVEQNRELSGQPLLYTLQFTGSTPYLFELSNLVVWSLGAPLGIAALLGWLWSAVLCVRAGRGARRVDAIILTVWPALYLLLIGSWQARFVRHTLPLVPFCCLFAAGLLAVLWGAGSKPRRRWLAGAATAIVAAGTLTWGAAFASIYTTTDPRLSATGWIGENVAAGSSLLVEDKNDLVPVPLPGRSESIYRIASLSVTAEETPAKAEDFARKLAQGDLLVVPNRRWSSVLPALERYKIMRRYYGLLFSGGLGYTQAAVFSDPPHLGPFSWPDDGAEETFQVFDHPTVRLFRNTGRLSEAALLSLLLGSP